MAAAGEPFRTSFDPAELDREMRRAGFTRLEDVGIEALNARYFAGRADGLTGRGAGHVLSATV